MKVILLTDVKDVGKENDIVEVSDGYGKNFLIHKGLATGLNDKTLALREERLANIKKEHDDEISNAKQLKERLEAHRFVLYLTSNHGRTFGVISNKNILDEINKNEKLIEKHMFHESYKLTIGESTIVLNLTKEIKANVRILVIEKTA